ncbi:MAG: NADH-quinone oxidoreductase subunit NuoE [bacterium]
MSCQCDKECGMQDKFDKILDKALACENPRSQLIEVLHQTQELYGYLTPEAMAAVSHKLGISMSRIYGVATFYHYFNLKPMGKYVISVCMGTACYVKGAPRVLDAVTGELNIHTGETTKDGIFTLLETRCLGACGLAPTMMINNRIHGDLTPKKVVDILRNCRDGKVKQ